MTRRPITFIVIRLNLGRGTRDHCPFRRRSVPFHGGHTWGGPHPDFGRGLFVRDVPKRGKGAEMLIPVTLGILAGLGLLALILRRD